MSVIDAGQRARTDPRISRRRKAVARSRRRRVLVRAAIVLVVVLCVWVALASPLLRVRSIRVAGARHTSSADVARAVGLPEDQNLLLLSTGEVERLIETLPWVREAAAERLLPGTVRVRVVERTPALVLSSGTGAWTLDRGGHVLQDGEVSGDLPRLTQAGSAGATAGERVDSEEVLAALRALAALPRSMRAEVEAVLATTPERITFWLRDGTEIRYGAAEHLEPKRAVLLAVLGRLRRDGVEPASIDVRAPGSPAIVPRPAATSSP